jgi:hypothetical protein
MNNKHLHEFRKVDFSKLYLDPNNPRTAPGDRPGYDDPDAIFPDPIQANLRERMEALPEVGNLEPSIVSQGWIPMDAILVWEHPKQKGHFVVVEGNTRTVVLRRLRERLVKEKERLERMEKKPKGYAKHDLEAQRQIVSDLEKIVADTDKLEVLPIKADSASELEARLPQLHGVRHISGVAHWTPYATNLYLLARYRQLFEAKHGKDKDLELEDVLLDQLAKAVPKLTETEVRRNIQAASAFSHFKRMYEDRVPKLTDQDQYFFSLILKHAHARKEFGFEKTDLHLKPEMEEVLFKWAFAKPRPERGGGDEEDENPNVFYKAENIRQWDAMRKYDIKKQTSFADQFSVDDPDSAPLFRKAEAEYLHHRAYVSPLDTIASLLEKLRELQVETLMSQASHLRPMIEEMINQGGIYLKMLDAATVKEK